MNANELERKLYELSQRFENEYHIKDGVIEVYGTTTPEQEELIKDHGLTIKRITE